QCRSRTRKRVRYPYLRDRAPGPPPSSIIDSEGSSCRFCRGWLFFMTRQQHEREPEQDPEKLADPHHDPEIHAEERRQRTALDSEGEAAFPGAKIQRDKEEQIDDHRIQDIEKKRRHGIDLDPDPPQDNINLEGHANPTDILQKNREQKFSAGVMIGYGDRP